MYFDSIFNSRFKKNSKTYFNEIKINQIYRTALYAAVKKENVEIIKLLIRIDSIDVHIHNIFIYFNWWNWMSYISIAFKIEYFNIIHKQVFKFSSWKYVLIKFKVTYLNYIHENMF